MIIVGTILVLVGIYIISFQGLYALLGICISMFGAYLIAKSKYNKKNPKRCT